MKSLLIVDDSALIRRLLKAALREFGWIVCEEAANGCEAIVKAQALRPDLIVLDLSMPEMNGFEAARILQRIMPAVPLIIFTTFASTIEKEAISVGFRKVISKSEPADIVNTIRDLLVA